MKQFEIWKCEFYNKYVDDPNFKALKNLLDNMEIFNWDVGGYIGNGYESCYASIPSLMPYKTKVRFYSNSILLSLGQLFDKSFYINFSVGRTDCGPNKQNLFLEQIDGKKIDLFKTESIKPFKNLAKSVGLNVDVLFDLIGFCYHTFMFSCTSPHTHIYPYNQSEWIKRMLSGYNSWRCDKYISLTDRYESRLRPESREKRLKVQREIPTLTFLPLYKQENNDDDKNSEDT